MTEIPAPTIASRVKLSEDVLFQELQGDAVLLDLKTGVYFGLDKVGTRIWTLLGEHKVIAGAVDAMTQQFDVTPERCAGDVLALVLKLHDHGLLEIE
jgi:predicted RNA-binding protein